MAESLTPDNYRQFFAVLKRRIQTAQLRASLPVNRELVVLYWQIGTEIPERQEREHWSRNVLVHQIDSGLYMRQGAATTNFNRVLQPSKSDLVQQITKDPCNFDFLMLDEEKQDLNGGRAGTRTPDLLRVKFPALAISLNTRRIIWQ